MTSYPTKYLFIAETQGIKQAAAELNALLNAMNKMNRTAGATGGGGSSSFGPGKSAAKEWEGLSGYVDKFGQRMRSALAYSVAFGVIGAAAGAVAGSIKTWVDAQVQLNEVIANTSILLGRSAQEGMQFANTQRALAFATGQDLSEIAPASMMAERVGQPGLATSAAQWSMVVGPQLNASETVDDLRALSIQFENLSLDQINNGLLAVMQNSGIAADQLFDLSASFGVFAGQLGLGETEEDLRKIGGLFAALSNITGQTTPTLQNFVRRMADEFYDPNAALRQQLEASGIQTVTQGQGTTSRDMFGNVTKSGDEIRRSFIDIFAEIAAKGPDAIRAFSTAIDNSLGQPTQSQFIQVADFWTLVDKTLDDTSASVTDFSDAVNTAGAKTSTGLGQVKTGIENLFSAIGDGEGFARAVRTVAAAFQNTYDVIRDPDAGMTRISRGKELNNVLAAGNARGIESTLSSAYGDDFGNMEIQRRLFEILRVIEVPLGLNTAQRQEYSLNAATQFAGSKFVRGGDVGTVGAQQFQSFLKSGDFDITEALKAALGGMLSDQDIAKAFSQILTEAELAALGINSLGTEAQFAAGGITTLETALAATANSGIDLKQAFMEAANSGRDVGMALGPFASGASFAENELINLAGAAAGAAGVMGAFSSMPTFKLPEGYGVEDFRSAYARASGMVSGFELESGLTYSDSPRRDVAVTDSAGMPLGALNQNPDISGLALSLIQKDEQAKQKALSEQKSYQSKALAAQEAYQSKMLGSWNGMVSDLLKPSAVTGTDLFYNSQTGAYNDNWDEPVRRMRADINNAISGKQLEYNWGGLAPYMNMGAIESARGQKQEVKEAVLRSEEAGVSERFYNMELPWEAYSGNSDAIVANAQAWIAGKQQKNANTANVQQLLVDAGLGPDAEAFVKAMEEPPILRQLFGGKSSEEISTSVTEAVTPNLGKAISEQVANVSWAVTISSAIQTDVTNNYETIVATGKAIGEPLAKGAAAQMAGAIIPLILKALAGMD